MRNRRLAGKRMSIAAVKLGTVPASQTRPYKPANPTITTHKKQAVMSTVPKRYNQSVLKSMTIKELTDLAWKDLNLVVKISWRKGKIIDEIIKAQEQKILVAS